MQATSKDLRFHTKEIMDTAQRGEEVIITYHGKPYVKITQISQLNSKSKENTFCGMWKDKTDMDNVDKYIRKLRKGRQF